MSTYIEYRDGGKTSEEGLYKATSRLLVQGFPTITTPSSLQATQRGSGANMSVDLQIGDVLIPNTSGTYSYVGWTDAVTNQTIAASSPSNPRVSVVVAYVNLSVVSSASNNNPGALAFMEVAGTPASSPVAPTNSAIQAAVGAGTPWTDICQVTVPTNATQIVTANITDTRNPFAVHSNLWGGTSNTNGHVVPNVADDTVVLANATQTLNNKTLGTGSSIVTNGWQPSSATFTYGSNSGSREFVVNTSTNTTSYLQGGMKLGLTRGTTPPTQCMAFTAASSQCASIASPAGITFGSAFTCETSVYLKSYTGATQMLVSRRTGTTGAWELYINSSGQVCIEYGDGSNNFTTITSFQSIPLNQWTHVAGTITSVASKTGSILINGSIVPSALTSNAATSMVQTGPLTLGAFDAGVTDFLDGYLAETRVWSAAQSATSIANNMGISIAAQTNLVGAWPGNGSWADVSGNSNTLIASNGAVNNQASNPYSAIEYFFIVAATSTTLTLRSPTGMLPNMTLTTPIYSNVDCPFGWPVTTGSIAGLRLLELPFLAQQTTTATSASSFGGSNNSTSVWQFTTPANCSKIKVKIFNNAFSSGSTANTTVFYGYNLGQQLFQVDSTTANGFMNAEILIPVLPGTVINFNLAFSTTAGTSTWASTVGAQEQGVMVEAA